MTFHLSALIYFKIDIRMPRVHKSHRHITAIHRHIIEILHISSLLYASAETIKCRDCLRALSPRTLSIYRQAIFRLGYISAYYFLSNIKSSLSSSVLLENSF